MDENTTVSREKINELLDEVRNMRILQKQYFQTLDVQVLQDAKSKEKVVDKMLWDFDNSILQTLVKKEELA